MYEKENVILLVHCKILPFITNDILILLSYVHFLDLLDKPNRQLTSYSVFLNLNKLLIILKKTAIIFVESLKFNSLIYIHAAVYNVAMIHEGMS